MTLKFGIHKNLLCCEITVRLNSCFRDFRIIYQIMLSQSFLDLLGIYRCSLEPVCNGTGSIHEPLTTVKNMSGTATISRSFDVKTLVLYENVS
jgi:hypothetical protein